ncbi:hypothetical protein IWW48_003074 [Coemansia sp. RSA 1200]|nr:hypothetical protein IWW48_003074 [Coemansia sp. RSA 1200]
MASNSRINKLSTHVKGYFSGLKRRKHDSSSSTGSNGSSSDGASTIAPGDQYGTEDLEIIHLSMEKAKLDGFPRQVSTGYVEVPMNYWLTHTDDEEGSEKTTAASSPKRSKEVAVTKDKGSSKDDGISMPLRIPPQTPTPTSTSHPTWFSQDEWEEKAGEALFGSLRSRSRIADQKHQHQHQHQHSSRRTGRSKRIRRQADTQAADPYDFGSNNSDSPVSETLNGWTEKKFPHLVKQTNNQKKSHLLNNMKAGDRKNHMDDMITSPVSSFLNISSSSEPSSPTPRARNSQTAVSAQAQCTNALDELLFATNARVEAELQGLPQCYIDGRDVAKLGKDFNTIVSHAYDDFVPAARNVLSTVSQMGVHQSAVIERTGLMDTLVGEIVASYADEASSAQLLKHYDDYAIYSSADLEEAVGMLDVSTVKYSKEQMAMYASTSISKYVSSQVLLSTGIENDLVDQLESSTQAMEVVMGQIDVLESLDKGDSIAQRQTDGDLLGLRKKARKWETRIRQLQKDVTDASHIRKTFELVFIQVQRL